MYGTLKVTYLCKKLHYKYLIGRGVFRNLSQTWEGAFWENTRAKKSILDVWQGSE